MKKIVCLTLIGLSITACKRDNRQYLLDLSRKGGAKEITLTMAECALNSISDDRVELMVKYADNKQAQLLAAELSIPMIRCSYMYIQCMGQSTQTICEKKIKKGV